MNDIQEYSTAAVVTGPVTVGQGPAPVSFVFDAGLLPLIPGTGASAIRDHLGRTPGSPPPMPSKGIRIVPPPNLRKPGRLLGGRAYSSIASMRARYWGVPSIHALHEDTFFGLFADLGG